MALGHAPAVAALLCPSLATRAAWALTGFEARAVVAEEARTGTILGCVQFVRARRDAGTWMFGHWRVASSRRREGVGRGLIGRGLGLLPRIRRLYSYVDWGNEVSILAHQRLGFETAAPICGRAPLGALSTIGPAAPPARLRAVSRRDGPVLQDLYQRAMGPLWFRLFPGDGRFAAALGAGLESPPLSLRAAVGRGAARLFSVHVGDAPAAAFLVVRGGSASATLYVDPPQCDVGLLAKVALRLLAMGASRDLEMDMHGLRRETLELRGPILARIMMGMSDVSRLAAASREEPT